ncbi:DNA primase [Buchnera aphidicola]|uniref:DNA primase n=1 Tax=Buchnera aphidicola (Stegophylla sp.) TaxID=2315800 RepID=A0A4D6YIN7_9GAMM|nr:DNA primase [Buchnera aphidicola (Stegophylla sp.)]QCI26241.1 DNA primase [Buchnera aphidicola (Stegophylla sp.)]
MKNFISKDFIHEILKNINIVDVINTRVTLKKSGNNYIALCPFHNEKTPSFTINSEKQYFYCFGCHIHGNVIDFLIKYNQLTFLESIKELAYSSGIKIPTNKYNKYYNELNHKKQKLYNSIKEISTIYQKNLQSRKCKKIHTYLKNRKIDPNMINYFNIGFSFDTINILKSKMFTHNDHIPNLITCGILVKTNIGYLYDRFHDRITFPIKNEYGNIIGFGGRILNHNQSKYINSPNTEIFDKGKQIYGIYETKLQNPKPKYLLIVEGYFDVISLTQFNIKNVVSTLGTSITNQQIQKLFKTTKKIIFCYDGDNSGEKAAWRTLKKILPYMHDGYNIKFIFLPINEDPDSIIHKEGTKKFKNRINQSVNILDFFLHTLLKKVNLCSINGKIKLLNLSMPLINTIPSVLTKIYFRRAIGLKIDIVDEYQLQKIFYINQKNEFKYIDQIIKKTNMNILISLIVQNPDFFQFVPNNINKIPSHIISGLSFFIQIFKLCRKYKKLNTGQLIELYRDQKTIFNIINKFAYWDNMINPNNKKKVFSDLIKKIYNINLENKYKKLIDKFYILGLNKQEKYKLWKINKILSQRKIK